mgnify:CR=1 FL=1
MAKFNEYTVKATPEDADTLMLYDAASKTNKLSPFSGIWNWMVNKLTNAVINNLQTSNKTVVGALNELNSNRKFSINPQSNTYDNFEAVFNKCLELSIIGVEEVFCVNIKSFESYCIVKFYKRSDDSAKMIVFRYDGITIVDGATNSLFIKSIVAE